jgi:uncharacterized protein (TIGR02266 family)
LADPNTRQGKRTPVTLKIKFKSETLEQFIERYAVDVSQGGIFIRTKEPLAVGTQMRFEFQLRDASPLIGGEGTVVWTRENDPSRPAIAPGMGVRFDRLADGSQTVLERILSEKMKQAPARTPTETTKPPLFTDTPTRVAPPPVQEALLNRHGGGGFPDQHTPLPKPMPFHSDADEFPDEAFEEATKVRALDDLIARTAEHTQESADELAARRAVTTPVIRHDSTLADPPSPADQDAADEHPSGTLSGFASGRPSVFDRESAPGLPPEPSRTTTGKRLLDTSPSPRTETADSHSAPMEKLGRTHLGVEPAHVQTRPGLTPAPSYKDMVATTRTSGIQQAVAESTQPVRMPPEQRRSLAPMIILALMVLAGGGAAVWFFVLRDKAVERAVATNPSGSASSGSSAIAAGTGSAGGEVRPAPPPPPKAELVETELTALPADATLEVVGTDQKGASPFKAKLEKGKAYKVRIAAPAFLPVEIEVVGGATTVPQTKLEPKPKVIAVASTPEGALIVVDGALIGGHSTPYEVTLTAAQAAKKSVRIAIRKAGYRAVERVIDTAAFTEEAARLVAKLDEKMSVQQVVIPRPPPNPGSGSASGSDGTTQGSDSSGSDNAPPTTTPTPTPGPGSAEPTPDFVPPSN